MLIHRNVIKSLHPATASNDIRYGTGLSAIYIDPESRECIATDGHILIRAAAPTDDEMSDFPGRINGNEPINPSADVSGLIDADALLTAAKATPRRSTIPVTANVAVTGRTTLVAVDLERGSTTIAGRDLETDGARFPAWRSVFTGPPASANSFTLSAELLSVLVKVAREQGRAKKDARVTFHVIPDQGTHGVYFDVGDGINSPKIDGIVMPLRPSTTTPREKGGR